MTVPFGPGRELFRFSVFVIFVNRLISCFAAAGALHALQQPLAPAAPLPLFAVPSLANLLSSTAQYEALKYVSMPLQALAKSSKMLPVMVWTILLRSRRQTRSDYACALGVTLGCALFVTRGSIAAPQLQTALATSGGGDGSNIVEAAGAQAPFLAVGMALLVAFLLFDGLASTSQDKLFRSYNMHSCNQLLWVSAWSALLSGAYLIASGELMEALVFVARHPAALGAILALSVVSTSVQLFIFFTIRRFGALSFAMLMTLRQFASLCFSVVIFEHHPTLLQWLGAVLVVAALVMRTMHKQRSGETDGNNTLTPQLQQPQPGTNTHLKAGSDREMLLHRQIPVPHSPTSRSLRDRREGSGVWEQLSGGNRV